MIFTYQAKVLGLAKEKGTYALPNSMHQRQVNISKELDVTKNLFSSEPHGPPRPAPLGMVFDHPCLSWRTVCAPIR